MYFRGLRGFAGKAGGLARKLDLGISWRNAMYKFNAYKLTDGED